MKHVTFDDGRQMWALNAVDAAMLHQQIYRAQTYARPGWTLREGACVFDVGANIGLCSRWLTEQHRGLRLFAFEPAPETFAALERNAAEFTGAEVTLLRCALGERRGEAMLTFDRLASSMASLREEGPAVDARAWQSAVAADLKLPRVAVAAVELARRVLRRRVPCEVRTLSDVIAEYGVERIDLLKLDVEGVELQVLRGVSDADWARIEQVVVETDDVPAVCALLERQGFAVDVTQDAGATYRLLGLYNVFARRPPLPLLPRRRGSG
ncbi:MAG: FkbM family methyltransferase [Myxococcaceae bacterium]